MLIIEVLVKHLIMALEKVRDLSTWIKQSQWKRQASLQTPCFNISTCNCIYMKLQHSDMHLYLCVCVDGSGLCWEPGYECAFRCGTVATVGKSLLPSGNYSSSIIVPKSMLFDCPTRTDHILQKLQAHKCHRRWVPFSGKLLGKT